MEIKITLGHSQAKSSKGKSEPKEHTISLNSKLFMGIVIVVGLSFLTVPHMLSYVLIVFGSTSPLFIAAKILWKVRYRHIAIASVILFILTCATALYGHIQSL